MQDFTEEIKQLEKELENKHYRNLSKKIIDRYIALSAAGFNDKEILLNILNMLDPYIRDKEL